MSLSIGLAVRLERFGGVCDRIPAAEPTEVPDVTESTTPHSSVVCLSRDTDTGGRSGANCRRWRTAFASRSSTAQMRSKEYGQYGSAASSHCFASWKSRRPRASVGPRYVSTHRTASSRTAIMSRRSGASVFGGVKCGADKITCGWTRSMGTPVRERFASIAMPACTDGMATP